MYAIEIAKVGPDSYSAWSRWGSYVIGRRPSPDGRLYASFGERGGKQAVLGYYDDLTDAKRAIQTHATFYRRKGPRR